MFRAEEITEASNERVQKARNKKWHDIRNQVFVNFVLARNCGMPLPKSWVAENYATRNSEGALSPLRKYGQSISGCL